MKSSPASHQVSESRDRVSGSPTSGNASTITMEELAETMAVPRKGVEWQVRKLKSDGELIRVGPDKGVYWEVSE